jgi:transcriptional regulator with XRE-family HTH domain
LIFDEVLMNFRDLSEGTLGELIGEIASHEESGPRYVRKAWVVGAMRELKEKRKLAGLTQSEIASRLGTTQSAVARLENDREGRINLRRYAEYAIACGYAPLGIVLESLEDVQAFYAATPGRARSPIAFNGWLIRNNLTSLAERNVMRGSAITTPSSVLDGTYSANWTSPASGNMIASSASPRRLQSARPGELAGTAP